MNGILIEETKNSKEWTEDPDTAKEKEQLLAAFKLLAEAEEKQKAEAEEKQKAIHKSLREKSEASKAENIAEKRAELEEKIKTQGSESDTYLDELTNLNTSSNSGSKTDKFNDQYGQAKRDKIADANKFLKENRVSDQSNTTDPNKKRVKFAEENTYHLYYKQLSRKQSAKIIGVSMLAGAFFGASLASTFASYISPSFAIPVIGQFIGAGALGLIFAATIIGATVGGIAGAIREHKEYQNRKSGKYNTSTTVKDTSSLQNQSNDIVAEFVTT